MKKLFLIAAAVIALTTVSNYSFAQTTASATALVKATLVRGLTLQTSGTNTLNFGQIVVTGATQTSTITAQNGQQFLATGMPNTPVTVTYDGNVTLNNNAWVTANGGTNGTITFTTATVKGTGNVATYTNPVDVNSGGTATLVNTSGTGRLYLWVGGKIDVPANQPHGDYVGTFNISVAY
jgi:hypothetical protein